MYRYTADMHDTPPSPELSATFSLRNGDQSWGSERRMALLAAIGTEGSISAAARKIGLSYKAAWDAVDIMNSVSGDVLVERVTGGKRGGGAQLTPRAQKLLAWYQAVQAEHQRFMDVLSRFGPDSVRHMDLLHSMALQTSARNRFEGHVKAIFRQGVNDVIELEIAPSVVLKATLTHASTGRLALRTGRRALAFIKAQAVTITPLADTPPTLAADTTTRWLGHLIHTEADPTLREITLEITPGIQVTGLAAASAATQGLPASAPLPSGSQAQALFQASDVLLGTLD